MPPLDISAPRQPCRLLPSVDTCFLALVVIIGAAGAWYSRFSINSDGISYLEIAEAYAEGRWADALNTYWSPFYSWVLAIHLLTIRPTSYWEFPVIHLANFTIFIFAYYCFRFFLNELIRLRHEQSQERPRNGLSDRQLRLLGYSFFVWFSVLFTGVDLTTPDLLVSAFIYLSYALFLRLITGWRTIQTAFLLGVVLGLGYLAKAFMLPLALGFMACTLIGNGGLTWKSIRATLAIGSGLLVTAGTFIYGLSLTTGRLTSGDAGVLNYDWYVNHGAFAAAAPIEAPQVSLRPPLYDYTMAPWPCTCPPHYMPSYWYERRFKFSLYSQVLQWIRGLRQLRAAITPAYFGVGIWSVVLLATSSRPSKSGLQNFCIMSGPCVMGIALFVSVLVLARYVSPFLLVGGILPLALFGMQPTCPELTSRLVRVAIVVTLIGSLASVATITIKLAPAPDPPKNIHWEAARHAKKIKIAEGSRICVLGHITYHYWARSGRVRIVANIDDVDGYWNAASGEKAAILSALRGLGVEAMVSNKPPPPGSGDDWITLTGNGYSLFVLQMQGKP